MNTLLFKVDETTVRENPDAGRVVHYVPGKITHTIGENGQIYVEQREVVEIYSMTPARKYFYDYLPAICDCGAMVKHDELEVDYDTDCYRCPQCNELVDVELGQYE